MLTQHPLDDVLHHTQVAQEVTKVERVFFRKQKMFGELNSRRIVLEVKLGVEDVVQVGIQKPESFFHERQKLPPSCSVHLCCRLEKINHCWRGRLSDSSLSESEDETSLTTGSGLLRA